jgi:hypothetical protein
VLTGVVLVRCLGWDRIGWYGMVWYTAIPPIRQSSTMRRELDTTHASKAAWWVRTSRVLLLPEVSESHALCCTANDAISTLDASTGPLAPDKRRKKRKLSTPLDLQSAASHYWMQPTLPSADARQRAIREYSRMTPTAVQLRPLLCAVTLDAISHLPAPSEEKNEGYLSAERLWLVSMRCDAPMSSG